MVGQDASAQPRRETTLSPPGPRVGKAEIKDNKGALIGSATLQEGPKGVLMRLEVKGLTPGWHGLHFHEKADCSATDFTSAGAHVHGPAPVVHGLLNFTGNDNGDLPNLYVQPDGTAMVELYSQLVVLRPGTSTTVPALLDADGSAIVIHANPDDHMTQPIGGAGARVACGAITG
jgi:Cu-Zn family superoxide dismutase